MTARSIGGSVTGAGAGREKSFFSSFLLDQTALLTRSNRSTPGFVLKRAEFANVVEMQSGRTTVYVRKTIYALVEPPASRRVGKVAVSDSVRALELFFLLLLGSFIATPVLAVNWNRINTSAGRPWF